MHISNVGVPCPVLCENLGLLRCKSSRYSLLKSDHIQRNGSKLFLLTGIAYGSLSPKGYSSSKRFANPLEGMMSTEKSAPNRYLATGHYFHRILWYKTDPLDDISNNQLNPT